MSRSPNLAPGDTQTTSTVAAASMRKEGAINTCRSYLGITKYGSTSVLPCQHTRSFGTTDFWIRQLCYHSGAPSAHKLTHFSRSAHLPRRMDTETFYIWYPHPLAYLRYNFGHHHQRAHIFRADRIQPLRYVWKRVQPPSTQNTQDRKLDSNTGFQHNQLQPFKLADR